MLKIRPTGAALAAEILGVNLAAHIDDKTLDEIVAAFHEHEVVFFRNQNQVDGARDGARQRAFLIGVTRRGAW